jgi:hypothetical protein
MARRFKKARMPIRLYKICTKISAITRDQHKRSVAQHGEDIEKLISCSARESSSPKASNTCFVQVLNLAFRIANCAIGRATFGEGHRRESPTPDGNALKLRGTDDSPEPPKGTLRTNNWTIIGPRFQVALLQFETQGVEERTRPTSIFANL